MPCGAKKRAFDFPGVFQSCSGSISVIVKICRVQRCNVERVKKKEFKTFLLHCWNCTFAPPNFLNLFSGSV